MNEHILDQIERPAVADVARAIFDTVRGATLETVNRDRLGELADLLSEAKGTTAVDALGLLSVIHCAVARIAFSEGSAADMDEDDIRTALQWVAGLTAHATIILQTETGVATESFTGCTGTAN